MQVSPSLSSIDDAQLRRADKLYASVLIIVGLYIGVMVLLGQLGNRLIAPFLIMGVGVVTVLLQKRQRLHAAMAVFVWGIWSAVSIQGVMRNGLANAALFAYPALMLLGGWVLGIRQGFLIGIASIVATFFLALAEQEGWIVGRRFDSTPMLYWLPMAIVIGASMAAMLFILKVHWEGIKRTALLNAQLQSTVATLSEREMELRRSEQQFQKISECSPLPTSIWSVEHGRCAMVNQAWVREFGWTQEEALGKTSVELGFWDQPTARQNWLYQLRQEGRVTNYPMTVKTISGDKKEMLLSSEIIDFDGETSILSIAYDLTERLKIEYEVRHLNETLETRVAERTAELSQTLATLKRAQDELVQSEKLASLGQLVAGVAHELNTPIGNALMTTTAMSDSAQNFQAEVAKGNIKRSSLDAFIQQSLEGALLAERSLHRASELVRSFKQVAVDQASERRRRFDLKETVSEIIYTLRPNFKGTAWRFEVDIPADIELDSYPGPLGQIVINLVMNAVLHAFEGRAEGRVILHAEREGTTDVVIVCSDDGNGIPSDHLPRIFDPFFTTRLGQGGSGLGLSIVHGLVTQVLGGQLRVESTVGNGTRFTLKIPLLAPELAG
jgi:PAS domain S-box-containing protein